MAEMRVSCLLDRSWDPVTRSFVGTAHTGTLIGISTQSSEAHSGEQIPVGIVALDNNTFQSVPLEFITKITD